tara:strand:- start:2674 stop:2922 length:249 start_codon:yes stop_codon:yes gene_type:complete
MRITRHQLRRIIREAIDQVSYDVGREDALADLPPADDDPDYMMGYNDILIDMGEEPVGPPASGSGAPLDPADLQHAHVGGGR